jgi:hypothetical protein
VKVARVCSSYRESLVYAPTLSPDEEYTFTCDYTVFTNAIFGMAGMALAGLLSTLLVCCGCELRVKRAKKNDFKRMTAHNLEDMCRGHHADIRAEVNSMNEYIRRLEDQNNLILQQHGPAHLKDDPAKPMTIEETIAASLAQCDEAKIEFEREREQEHKQATSKFLRLFRKEAPVQPQATPPATRKLNSM